MRIDVLLDPFGATWDDIGDAATAAEANGWDGVWLWDHLSGVVHGAPHVLECWTVLSAIAARTTRIQLGPMVLNVANRDPGVLAVMAATLQHVSKGRLLLGIGAGGGPDSPYAEEQHQLQRPVDHDPARRRAVHDAVIAINRAWDTPGVLTPAPKPPIIVGGFGPKMLGVAHRCADGFNAPLGPLLTRPPDNPGFILTASAPLSRRAQAEAAGVDRLIVYAAPPYDAIRRGTTRP